jgi:radical SAM superfamily enzyme YgiQ (UPF0313 family)
MYDIVFCSLPYSDLDHIYSAPAVLKGVVKENGFSAKTVEFGFNLLRLCDNDVNVFSVVQGYFISPETNLNDDTRKIIDAFYDSCIDWFIKNPSKYIGISVLSVFTHKATFELLKKIHKANINSKIVLGGRGCKISVYSGVYDAFSISSVEKLLPYGELIKKKKLCDHVIIGDGEDEIINLLTSQDLAQENVDNISDYFKYPVPDYDDYEFDQYLFTDKIMLPVTGSKGCVRDCDFCDVKFHFGKYRYRSGSDIANEMISLSKKYKIYKFQFTDSLVNGSLRIFKEFLEILSEYNLKNPDCKITWNGQYICREPHQVPKGIYKLIADSGGHGLSIGAESGSNDLLTLMNKKTSVEALYHELEEFRKHNLTCVLLTFVGHWGETWEDFVKQCQMFVKVAPYVKFGTVSALMLGHPMMILEGAPAAAGKENNMIFSDIDKTTIWYNKNNPSNTYKERVYRRLIVEEICKKLNIPTINDLEYFNHINSTLKVNGDKINEFYLNVG